MAKRGTKANMVIKGARVFDPAAGLDRQADVTIEKGVIAAIGAAERQDLPVIEAADRLLLPGFVDPHVHLRTPGFEYKEDIASGTAAAAAGGYVTICAMPNTDPVVDNVSVMSSLIETAEREAAVRVAFFGSISRGLAGSHLSDIWDMAAAGAVGFTDDGRPVSDGGLLASALKAVALVDLPLSLHCEDAQLAAAGVMNEGEVSARLGLAGTPGASESADVAKALEIAAYERGRVHIAHLSCARSLAQVEQARLAGARVTCEAAPHHLLLTDEAVAGLDTNFKMNPPLRSEADRQALVAGLASGAVDCIATDHAPHAAHEKEVPFEAAPFGVVGLETAFPLLYSELVEPGLISLDTLVLAMSTNPAQAFGLPVPALAVGQEADLCLIDTAEEFTVEPEQFFSKARNSAFAGRRVKGRVLLTIAAGKVAYKR